MWARIYDLIIKTIISCERSVLHNMKKIGTSSENCFDLFGFDVLLDADLKPWLLEVNLSPSLATEAPIDMHIKSMLISDTFNLIGVRKADKKRDYLSRLRTKSSIRNKISVRRSTINRSLSPPIMNKEKLSTRNYSILRDTLEEFTRRSRYIRIYPSKNSNYYDQFFEFPRTSNTYIYNTLFIDMMDDKEFSLEDSYNKFRPATINSTVLVRSDLGAAPMPPLKMPKSPQSPPTPKTPKTPKVPHTANPGARFSVTNPKERSELTSYSPVDCKRKCANCKLSIRDSSSIYCISCRLKKLATRDEKIVITGDDVLMEYLKRLIKICRETHPEKLKPNWVHKIDRFVRNEIWKLPDNYTEFHKRLHVRLYEMQDRKKKLSISNNQMDYTKEDEKRTVVKSLTSHQIEDMLRASIKSGAQEVVGLLLDDDGLLSEMERITGIETREEGEEEESEIKIEAITHETLRNRRNLGFGQFGRGKHKR
jgi:hypothetical protein